VLRWIKVGATLEPDASPANDDPIVTALPCATDRYRRWKEYLMTYVLVVISWLGGAVNGATISTQEFTSAERCEAARLALIEDAKARAFEDTLRPFCMQK
jgi:hypothetical protein